MLLYSPLPACLVLMCFRPSDTLVHCGTVPSKAVQNCVPPGPPQHMYEREQLHCVYCLYQLLVVYLSVKGSAAIHMGLVCLTTVHCLSGNLMKVSYTESGRGLSTSQKECQGASDGRQVECIASESSQVPVSH